MKKEPRIVKVGDQIIRVLPAPDTGNVWVNKNGNKFETEIWLGIGDDPENYEEIIEEYKNEIEENE